MVHSSHSGEIERCLFLACRIERLARCFLDNQAVVFVGAGVSSEAKSGGDKKFEPAVWGLQRSLAKALTEWTWSEAVLQQERLRTLAGWLELKLKDGNATPKCHFYRDLKTVSLDRLAEVTAWTKAAEDVDGWVKLCETLQIEQYAKLVPRPSHRYLAYLAREGVLSEIITTNYDTCLEEAFCNSFGVGGDRGGGEGDDGNGRPVYVITSRQTYQQHGARRRTNGVLRRPVWRVYKINGCAHEYDETKSETARRIALTERQLQGWRDNRWARDMFCDRARSHTLVFSGFGSNEPQIRHTVLALLEERSEADAQGVNNRPFIHQFGEQLTFNQQQILRAYYPAEAKKGWDVGREQQFTGSDAAEFPAVGHTHSNGLCGDAFWKGVYVRVLRGLVERYSQPGYAFYQWLTGCTRGAARFASMPGGWLFPSPHDQPFGRYLDLFSFFIQPPPNDAQPPAVTQPKETAPQLVAKSDDGGRAYDDAGRGPMLLWRWLATVRHRPLPNKEWRRDDNDWYLPLREDSVLFLSTVLLLSLFRPLDAVTGVEVFPRLGLRVLAEQPSVEGRKESHVFLVARGAPPPVGPVDVEAGGTPPTRGALLVQVVLPHRGLAGSRALAPAGGRWWSERSHGSNEKGAGGGEAGDDEVRPRVVRVGRYQRIEAGVLLEGVRSKGEDAGDMGQDEGGRAAIGAFDVRRALAAQRPVSRVVLHRVSLLADREGE